MWNNNLKTYLRPLCNTVYFRNCVFLRWWLSGAERSNHADDYHLESVPARVSTQADVRRLLRRHLKSWRLQSVGVRTDLARSSVHQRYAYRVLRYRVAVSTGGKLSAGSRSDRRYGPAPTRNNHINGRGMRQHGLFSLQWAMRKLHARWRCYEFSLTFCQFILLYNFLTELCTTCT